MTYFYFSWRRSHFDFILRDHLNLSVRNHLDLSFGDYFDFIWRRDHFDFCWKWLNNFRWLRLNHHLDFRRWNYYFFLSCSNILGKGILLSCWERLSIMLDSRKLIGTYHFNRINTSWPFIQIERFSERLKLNGLTRIARLTRMNWVGSYWWKVLLVVSWMNSLGCIVWLMRSWGKYPAIKILLVYSSDWLLINTERRLFWRNSHHNSFLNYLGLCTLIK